MEFQINQRIIGPDSPTYIIAEMSANHGQDFDSAVALLHESKTSGRRRDQIANVYGRYDHHRLQQRVFSNRKRYALDGNNLYQLYQQAYTPWEWHQPLRDLAAELELDFFSTPFDETSVQFLESLRVPAYKIASFEVVDLPLIRRVAQTGKPVIMSTGMASEAEIAEAITVLRNHGCPGFALLKCTSAYPAPPESMNLRTIAYLANRFDCAAGLSDHTLGIEVPIASIALGACIIEKHLTLCRENQGPDDGFSLEPREFVRWCAPCAQRSRHSAEFGWEPRNRNSLACNFGGLYSLFPTFAPARN